MRERRPENEALVDDVFATQMQKDKGLQMRQTEEQMDRRAPCLRHVVVLGAAAHLIGRGQNKQSQAGWCVVVVATRRSSL